MENSELTNLDDTIQSGGDNEDDDEIQITPAELVGMIEEMWINEKFAPEILPHKYDVILCMLEQIDCMERNLETLDNKDLIKNIHKLEVDRLRFMVTSYLRIRLKKVEDYVLYILQQEEERAKNDLETYLSDNELSYAKSYKEGLEKHFNNFLNVFPITRSNDWKKMPNKPNLRSYIFLKSKDDIQGVLVSGNNDEELIDFSRGSQMIMQYSNVANLIKDGRVSLI